MELEDILRQIRKRWWIVLFFVVVAIAGTWLYHNVTGKEKATALVAVKQPREAAPGEYIPPQITFETLDESLELADRVAGKLADGSTGQSIKSAIDVRIRISSEPSFTPLYEVSYSDPDAGRALAGATILLEESRALYQEINEPDEMDVRAAFEGEIAGLETSIGDSRAALGAFESENNAFELTKQIERVSGFINELQLMRLQLGLQSAAQGDPPLTNTQAATREAATASIAAIDQALAQQSEEFLRLKGLEPAWLGLSINIQRLETQLSNLRQQVTDIIAGQTLPAQGSVEVMSQPELTTNLFFLIVTYGLALIAGLFLSLSIVYLMAVFDRGPLTVAELEAVLGIPVLARVPNEAP